MTYFQLKESQHTITVNFIMYKYTANIEKRYEIPLLMYNYAILCSFIPQIGHRVRERFKILSLSFGNLSVTRRKLTERNSPIKVSRATDRLFFFDINLSSDLYVPCILSKHFARKYHSASRCPTSETPSSETWKIPSSADDERNQAETQNKFITLPLYNSLQTIARHDHL